MSSPPRFPARRPALLPAGAVLALCLVSALPAAGQATQPCTSPGYGEFDFWVGTWDVFAPDGRRAGTNTIRKTLGGCVLHERYTTPAGFEGESFNTWDADRGGWHQTWVDATGTLLVLEGRLEGASMVLRGETVRPDGTTVLNRINWTPLADPPDHAGLDHGADALETEAGPLTETLKWGEPAYLTEATGSGSTGRSPPTTGPAGPPSSTASTGAPADLRSRRTRRLSGTPGRS